MRIKNMLQMTGLIYFTSKWVKRLFSSSYLNNKVVLITGGSRGLGLALAKHIIQERSRVAICARDEQELKQAKEFLQDKVSEVFTFPCDVSDKNQVENLIKEVADHFGQIDVVINNAGIITVGAMENFNHQDYEAALNVMYWGTVNMTQSVLPYMRKRRQGHIVNITSIGGKVSVPHLLPYNSAKFAAVGFSEGSAAELRKDNIYVTTIIPGLMRTGSYVNALFQKNNKKEFKLFSLLSSTPGLAINADKAAKQIVRAIKEKRTSKVIGFPAKALIEVHHFIPGLLVSFFGLVTRFLPSSEAGESLQKGSEIAARNHHAEVAGIKRFGLKAQEDHQFTQTNSWNLT